MKFSVELNCAPNQNMRFSSALHIYIYIKIQIQIVYTCIWTHAQIYTSVSPHIDIVWFSVMKYLIYIWGLFIVVFF